MSGACSSPPCSDAASTAIAFGAPVAHRFVPFERIDRDVDLGNAPLAVRRVLRHADLLADVQHRRLVALALADDDRAVDRHDVHVAAHRFDGHVVRLVAIALAHRVRARDRGLFDDAQEIERQV